MKVVGLVALANFPYWRMCMEKLREQVDEICVRVDVGKENKLEELLDSKLADKVITSTVEWNRYNWRNELLTMVTGADIVLTPDQDEIFEDTIKDELIQFYNSDAHTFVCDFVAPMPTNDGRIIPELNGKAYPSTPHCMGFKWKQGVTYYPYEGLCFPTGYNQLPRFAAKTKVAHYCMWTKELEEEKKQWVINEYGIF